ncbi:MAG: M28 family metallopeptidase [Syntrophobacteraceae bacterium]
MAASASIFPREINECGRTGRRKPSIGMMRLLTGQVPDARIGGLVRPLAFLLFFLMLCILPVNTPGAAAAEPCSVLALVEVPGLIEDLGLPIHSELLDAAGQRYALVISSVGTLQNAGVGYTILDDYTPGIPYLLAFTKNPGLRLKARSVTKVLYDDGRQIIVRSAPELGDVLARMGFRLRLVSETPMILKKVPSERRLKAPTAFEPNALVTEMIASVDESAITGSISGLSGQTPVTIEGSAYTLTTRSTMSGEAIQKATQYAYEYFTGLGLTAGFQSWSSYWGLSGRNVVAEIPGTTLPGEIILIVAHIDDVSDAPSDNPAPGADDNASGSAAVMAAANIMKDYKFERTIRFILFTGEEQGLYGSEAYANFVYNAGQDIVAVLNLDMVSYNTDNTIIPNQLLHIRSQNYEAELELTDTYRNVIQYYGLSGSLSALVRADSMGYSDHSSFWYYGFPAVCIIEDWELDETPYYHKVGDVLATLDMDYCTAIVKATLGAAAHLALPSGRKTGYMPWLPLLLDSRLGNEWLSRVNYLIPSLA